MKHSADIVIFGAGIAGLWVFNRLKRAGYDVLLLENERVGGGQSIASQGIIHSGLKYAFGGKVNKLAQSISAMPDIWRAALKGEGPVDISAAKVSADSQYLLVPSGLMGGLVKLVTKKALGQSVEEIAQKDWPQDIKASGFKGSVIYMGEPVLDIPSVIRALAEPYKDRIRLIKDAPTFHHGAEGAIESIEIDGHSITAQQFIFTGAAANAQIAQKLSHDKGLQTQKRPLLMGMLKNAPFELYAHMVGNSDKPVATITTHTDKNGAMIWYLGGGVAERAKDSNPKDVYSTALQGFAKYMPELDLSNMQWATLPIDRVESKSDTQGFMPDIPTIHAHGNALYCWPTKLTFAPMLSDMVVKKLEAQKISPGGTQCDWSFLPPAPYTQTPWDEAQWTSLEKERSAIRG